MNASRRVLLGAALGGAASAAVGLPATTAHAASWQQKWSPSASGDGLGAFETIEDDRARSHPAGHPIVVQSLRRVNGKQTIELKLAVDDILVGRTGLDPLHDKWTDVDFQIKVGNGSAGSIRWILKSGGSTVIDASKRGVDTFLADRVRPKWGIYRSLGDTSGSLQDTYLLLTGLRGYQLV
ncbi:hypothetical protein [Streptomyces sp. NBC_00847]|uniref:hypothetical protein n=1 Tax=unclassified Streptomyces TaxID=2593676 RepID=UPI002252522A|nr:hypothetical protein [Streptomyces sp. NBC_00847]MCX4885042.1 hypothetical protein [Streptomyces sp. NBC_00847]